jgi:hypothetical protein
MNDAMGMMWDWEILDAQVLPDNSGIAFGRMTLHWEDDTGREHTRVITEIGGKEAVKDMSLAFILQSAASRSLLRCMLRAFGYGIELYTNEDNMTATQAWGVLEDYAKNKGVKQADLVQAIKDAGITNETLVDRFEEAYNLVVQLAQKPKSKMPDLNKKEPNKELVERVHKAIRQHAIDTGLMKNGRDEAGVQQVKLNVIAKMDLSNLTQETLQATIDLGTELVDQLNIDLAKAKQPA